MRCPPQAGHGGRPSAARSTRARRGRRGCGGWAGHGFVAVPVRAGMAEAARVSPATVRAVAGQLGRHGPADEDQGALAHARDLLEVGGDEEDREACGQRVVEQAVDLGLGADVHARRSAPPGSAGAGPIRSQRPIMTFCWLPPDRVAIGASLSRGRTENRSIRAAASARSRRGLIQRGVGTGRRRGGWPGSSPVRSVRRRSPPPVGCRSRSRRRVRRRRRPYGGGTGRRRAAPARRGGAGHRRGLGRGPCARRR